MPEDAPPQNAPGCPYSLRLQPGRDGPRLGDGHPREIAPLAPCSPRYLLGGLWRSAACRTAGDLPPTAAPAAAAPPLAIPKDEHSWARPEPGPRQTRQAGPDPGLRRPQRPGQRRAHARAQEPERAAGAGRPRAGDRERLGPRRQGRGPSSSARRSTRSAPRSPSPSSPTTPRSGSATGPPPGPRRCSGSSPSRPAIGRKPFLFTQGQAILTRTWIPLQDSPGVRVTYEATRARARGHHGGDERRAAGSRRRRRLALPHDPAHPALPDRAGGRRPGLRGHLAPRAGSGPSPRWSRRRATSWPTPRR